MLRRNTIASDGGNDEGKWQANACKQHWYVDGAARLGGFILYFILVSHFKLMELYSNKYCCKNMRFSKYRTIDCSNLWRKMILTGFVRTVQN